MINDDRAPAGDVTVQARFGAGQDGVASSLNKTAKTITVGADAVIDVNGLWINLSDDPSRPPAYSKAWVNGGNVALSSGGTTPGHRQTTSSATAR